jgi:hypothetical protein
LIKYTGEKRFTRRHGEHGERRGRRKRKEKRKEKRASRYCAAMN